MSAALLIVAVLVASLLGALVLTVYAEEAQDTDDLTDEDHDIDRW